ncbi:hypothetical protein [Phascolarctobacterium succinatutens]|uniref:hypothetical protein n=1 Tax=Phascolarctobacterium succinatutens TaxID=626940 RepID=UPI003A8C8B4E
MLKDQNKSQHKAGLKRRKVRDYFFSCIPFFSNEFLESLTFWDWLPLIISIASLTASIAAYCKH